jgi:hypothetical protein
VAAPPAKSGVVASAPARASRLGGSGNGSVHAWCG